MEFLQIITFNGTVCTGQGRGKFFVALPWVMSQLKTLMGTQPYLGTLNLRLNFEGITQRVFLTPQTGVLIKPKNGYSSGYLYKAKFFDTDCYVVLPNVDSYPKDSLEIIAHINLRDHFNIKDGDMITVIVSSVTL
ncbi:MAG: CTP-dependent riboflavin kinase [Nitrososphaerota archaeon]|nr:CTP-dependent riboflavin kinase [Nitrososphaerota archaeon]